MRIKGYNARIVDYYKRSAWLYKYFWYSQRSLGLHCGFWDKATKNNDEAIINQYKYVIAKTKINQSMKILDAGCGVGGGAIYIAKNTGAKVVGITISPEQVDEANRNARKAKVDSLTEFIEEDYTKTSFADNTFDVVFAIESVCYAYPKSTFLNEAYRILRPGGVLLINDGYVKRKPVGTEEKNLFHLACEGWKVYEFVDYQLMTKAMYRAGFQDVVIEDKAPVVRPTLRSVAVLVNLFKPVFILTKKLKWGVFQSIRENIQSLATLAEGDRIGLFGYYSHVAKKT